MHDNLDKFQQLFLFLFWFSFRFGFGCTTTAATRTWHSILINIKWH